MLEFEFEFYWCTKVYNAQPWFISTCSPRYLLLLNLYTISSCDCSCPVFSSPNFRAVSLPLRASASRGQNDQSLLLHQLSYLRVSPFSSWLKPSWTNFIQSRCTLTENLLLLSNCLPFGAYFFQLDYVWVKQHL